MPIKLSVDLAVYMKLVEILIGSWCIYMVNFLSLKPKNLQGTIGSWNGHFELGIWKINLLWPAIDPLHLKNRRIIISYGQLDRFYTSLLNLDA